MAVSIPVSQLIEQLRLSNPILALDIRAVGLFAAAPKFIFVPSEAEFGRVQRLGTISYDIPGTDRAHRGEMCAFDAFLTDYRLDEPDLPHRAKIVRSADTGRAG